MKIIFTVNRIEAVKSNGTDNLYYDLKRPGLCLRLQGGNKHYYLYKKIKGKPIKRFLGKHPDITPDEAYSRALDILNQLDNIMTNTMSFKSLFDYYISHHAKPHKITWKTDKLYFDNHLQKLHAVHIDKITKLQLETLCVELKDKVGNHTANRVLALLSVIFNKAIDWGFLSSNPANKIKKFREQSRDRIVSPEELTRLLSSIRLEPNPVFRAFFLLALFTGARKSNLLAMEWSHIENNTWKIPVTKNGQSHIVPLAPEAMEVLNELPRISRWVLPSPNSASGHIEEPKKAWKRILKEAGIENLRIHDLRRTFASWQVRTGANSYIIGKTLGHKSQQATAIYAQVANDITRESVEKAVKAMNIR